MKRTTGGARCHEFECVQATESGGDWLNKSLYIVDGQPGLWRRVKNPQVSDPQSRGVLPAFFDAGIVYVKPAARETEEMIVAGWLSPNRDPDGGDDPPRPSMWDLFDQLVEAGKAAAVTLLTPVAAPATTNGKVEPAVGVNPDQPLSSSEGAVVPPRPEPAPQAVLVAAGDDCGF